ncbi:hypothetical protein D3C76_1126840 [compost metagenome]
MINLSIQERRGITVVIGANTDVLLHHLMADLQRPCAVLSVAGQTRQGAIGQCDPILIVTLMVMELDHINRQAIVVGEAIPDADLCQQTADEGQITLTVLHDVLALGVFA